MLFNSQVFIFAFLPITLVVFFIFRRFSPQLSIPWLVIASLFFYSYWNWKYLFLLLTSIAVNYLFYHFITDQNQKHRKSLLVTLGVIFNLGLLAYYKYSGFIVEDILRLEISAFSTPVLPLAISFFTFQQIAFIIDESRNDDERVGFVEYAAFVTFFPQLIAGPIVRHNELIPQLKKPRQKGLLLVGTAMFLIGLSKKVLVADGFAVWANIGFDNPNDLNFSDAWLGSLSYTMQLYFDFSGYSDMAIGLGLMFGFRLPQNFNSPYKSRSIQEFWRRWHITLSSWLRDYLYIQLGGNRKGFVRTYANLFLTMLLGGLWHGAAWTFVMWGAMHGFALGMNRLWSKLNIPMPTVIAWIITFVFVVFAWVFFRASSFADAFSIASAMASPNLGQLPSSWAVWLSDLIAQLGYRGPAVEGQESLIRTEAWLVIAVAILGVTFAPNSHEIIKRIETDSGIINLARIAMIGLIGMIAIKRLMEASVQSEFLYFQF